MTLEESREIIPLMESMIGLNGRNASGNAEPGHPTLSYAGTESEIAKIKQRVIRAAQHFAKYRGTTFQDGRTENEDRTFGKRKSAMADIGTEAEQRKQFITETELLNWNSR